VCRHAVFAVPPEPRSVPSARKFCRDTLSRWGLAGMVDDAQIVLSELVTNGVLHARTPLGVTVSAESGALEIAVSDDNPDLPTLRPDREDLAADLDELIATAPVGGVADDRDPRLDVGAAGSVVGGRGLQLVVSLAGAWGVDPSVAGKSVWARLPVPPGWPPATDCPCATGSTRLASGRVVAEA
jgi:hypothetical protein